MPLGKAFKYCPVCGLAFVCRSVQPLGPHRSFSQFVIDPPENGTFVFFAPFNFLSRRNLKGKKKGKRSFNIYAAVKVFDPEI